MLGPENRFLLVDGSYLLMASSFSMKGLVTSSGVFVGGIYGYISRLYGMMREYPCHTTIVAWDGGRSKRRMQLNPNYKTGRPDKDDDIIAQFKFATEFTNLMGIHQVRIAHVEADDIIAALAQQAETAVVMSADKDFYQLVSNNISVRKSVFDETVTPENFASSVNIRLKAPFQNPYEIRVAFGLMGDKIDCVPGVQGIGPKKAYDIISACRDAGHDLNPLGELKGLREVCKASKMASWKKVDTMWDSFVASLLLTDLCRDDILKQGEYAKILSVLDSTDTRLDYSTLMSRFNDLEFVELRSNLKWMADMLANRRKCVNVRRLV